MIVKAIANAEIITVENILTVKLPIMHVQNIVIVCLVPYCHPKKNDIYLEYELSWE